MAVPNASRNKSVIRLVVWVFESGWVNNSVAHPFDLRNGTFFSTQYIWA